MVDKVGIPRRDYLGDAAFQQEIIEPGAESPRTLRATRLAQRAAAEAANAAASQSERAHEIDPNRIGLWGTVESGKTTFLAVLYHVMNDQEWRIFGKGEANSFIEQMNSYVFEQREFPPPTGEDDVLMYEYELYYDAPGSPAGKTKDFMLSFVDASGEAFRRPKQWRLAHPERTHPLDELQRCGKIVCLLDAAPFMPSQKTAGSKVEPDEYFRDIFGLLSSLRENDPKRVRGQITSHRFAFCISKCDLPAIWEHRENVAQFAEHIFGSNVIREIHRYIPSTHYSWHAFSSVGPYFVDKRMDIPVINGKVRPEHIIQPFGIKEIVTGLFANDVA